MQIRERREFQRLRLMDPVEARFGQDEVRLVEIGISGARLEHFVREAPGRVAPLVFSFEGEQIVIEAEVVRSSLAPGASGDGAAKVHHTGIVFLGAREESADALRRALSAAVIRRLEQQKIQGPAEDLVDFDDTLRPGDALFLSYTLEDGVWKKRRAFLPEQPDVGFTVTFDADKDELQRLCRAYEQADTEGRRLLRLFCELSISDAMNVPRAR